MARFMQGKRSARVGGLMGAVSALAMLGTGVAYAASSSPSASPSSTSAWTAPIDPDAPVYNTQKFDSCDAVAKAGIRHILYGSQLYTVNAGNAALDKTSSMLCGKNTTGSWDVSQFGVVSTADSSHIALFKAANSLDGNIPNAGTPTSSSASPTTSATSSPHATSSFPAVVSYKDCADAQAHHSGPIPKSDPRYRADLDPNHNGVACEANTPVNQPLPAVGPRVSTDWSN